MNAQNYSFEHISIEQGLSQSSVNCTVQDKKGFIWLGTEDGLNRYDGYHFKIFRNVPGDSNSIAGNFIKDIIEDENGVLWIASKGSGLIKYDPISEKFSNFRHVANNSNSLSNDNVNSILLGKNNILWIGTSDGLNKFNTENEEFMAYHFNSTDSLSISANSVFDLVLDKEENLWIATRAGLDLLVKSDQLKEKENFLHFKYDSDNEKGISGGVLYCLALDKYENLWIGTNTNGLNKLSKKEINKVKKGQSHNVLFKKYLHDPNDESSISGNYIFSVFVSQEGTVWAGTNGKGLNKLDAKTDKFTRYEKNANSLYGISSGNVYSMFQDRNGIMWIGTGGGGISKCALSSLVFSNLTEDGDPGLSNGNVWSIIEDDNNKIWIGTGGGLNIYDPVEKKISQFEDKSYYDLKNVDIDIILTLFQNRAGDIWIGPYKAGLIRNIKGDNSHFEQYLSSPKDSTSLTGNTVNSIYEDSDDNLWIGLSAGGLNKFQYTTGRFEHYDIKDSSGTEVRYIMSIKQDAKGNLLLATNQGLCRFDPITLKTIFYKEIVKNASDLTAHQLYTLLVDKQGIIWCGTSGVGFYKLNPITNEIKQYTEENGLGNNVIYGILPDDKGSLWFSTNSGLSRFNPATEEFRNFDIKDGLPSNEFNAYAYHKSKDGKLYFGGINGVTFFHPDSIKKSKDIPLIVFTNFQIFNNDVTVKNNRTSNLLLIEGDNYFLPKSIVYSEEIVLSYRERVFSIEFSALHYASPGKNQYAYMMEGFDEEWVYQSSSKRSATYTNLDPGEYIFKVKASNEDGVWNEKGITLKITITPPFWKTSWFYALVILFVISGIYLFIRLRLAKLNSDKIVLIQKVQKRTQLLKEANVELEKLSIVASKTDNGVMITDAKGKIEWINEGLIKMLGYSLEEYKSMRGETLQGAMFSDDFDILLKKSIVLKETVIYENEMTTKSEEKIWVSTTLTPILDEENNIKKIIVIDTDITKLKESQVLLEKQNEQKSALLKEIHHRVKNNLQIVNSLLRIQSHQIQDKRVVKLFEESQDRVISMALLHEKMYKSNDLSHIDAREHFTLLSKDLIKTYQVDKTIELDLKVDELDIEMKTLVPLGLIINEMITNSLKYAFQNKDSGVVIVHIKHLKGENYELLIGDNGIGFPNELNWKEEGSLGLTLIRTFTEQLDGTIERLKVPGTLFKIVFKKIG